MDTLKKNRMKKKEILTYCVIDLYSLLFYKVFIPMICYTGIQNDRNFKLKSDGYIKYMFSIIFMKI